MTFASSIIGQTYTVRGGDFLSAIAQKFYGDGSEAFWRKIYEANKAVIGPDPSHIEVGMVLVIPNKDSSVTMPPASPGGFNKQIQAILAEHNQYRAEIGVPPLQWSENLAASAKLWANHLAQTGKFEHSGAGENLAQGTAGAFSVTQLVDMWVNEKNNFRNGTFPDVSNTGNWADVGHYTQLIWRNTTEVGCGIATGNGNDVLVCHYNPAGNVVGQNVF